MNKKISILLAVYNGEKYIAKSLQSLLNQSYENFEILIGFNGTSDRSKEIVNEFHDSRIKLFDYNNDKGKAKTLNKLLKECSGDWIAIQDDDDVWMPQKLKNQMVLCNDFDVIGSQIEYINEEDSIIGNVKLATNDVLIKEKSLKGDNQIANTSAIARKKCIEEINGWREDLDGIEDFDLWIRLMKKDYKFVNLSTTEVRHRLHLKSNFNTKKHDLSKILKQGNFKKQWWNIFKFFNS